MKHLMFFLVVVFGLALPAWSQNKINQYEYWFDDDFTNRTTVSILPISNFELNQSISTGSLLTGLHSIHMRFKDISGKYSSVQSNFFIKTVTSSVAANQIVAYEYWVDADYGNKVLVNTTSSSQFNLNSILSLASLTTGLHAIHIRFKDNQGVWSSVQSNFFMKATNEVSILPSLTKFEYWFDDNYSNMTTGILASQQQLSFVQSISTIGLSNGLHTVHFRFEDANGSWSSVLSQFFLKQGNSSFLTEDLVQYEYWFDNDYASAIQGSMGNTTVQTLTTNLDASALSNGLHVIRFRFKSTSQKWSSVQSNFFLKQENNIVTSNEMQEMEYWFDTMYVNKVNVPLAGNTIESIQTSIDATSLGNGLHTMNVRFKDSGTKWSSVLSQFVYKIAPTQLSTNSITAYRYWFDTNHVQMQTVQLASPSQIELFNSPISLVSIPKGNHTVHFQMKDSIGNWSSATNDTLYKYPLPIASFTADATVFCDSGSVNFDNLSFDAEEFLWDFGDGFTSTDSLATHTYAAPGFYTVSLTAHDTTMFIDSTLSITQLVIINETPDPTIFLSGNDSICVGNSVVLSSSPTGLYTWSDGSQSPTLNVNSTGSYFVTVASLDNPLCLATSDTIGITVMPLPDASFDWTNLDHTVTFTNASSVGDSYLWDFGDGNQSSQFSPVYDYGVNGMYDAYLVAYNFCGTDTAFTTIDLSFIGLNEVNVSHQLKLYPNPSNGQFAIELSDLNNDELLIVVYDQSGKLMRKEQLKIVGNKVNLNFESFENGIYWLELTNALGWTAKERIVVNHL